MKRNQKQRRAAHSSFDSELKRLRQAARVVRDVNTSKASREKLEAFDSPQMKSAVKILASVGKRLIPFLKELSSVGYIEIFLGSIAGHEAWVRKEKEEFSKTPVGSDPSCLLTLSIVDANMNGPSIQLNSEVTKK